MDFGAPEVAVEALQALLAAPEMAPEMELKMELAREPARVLGTAPSSQWALSFQPWLSFAVADPLTW